MDVTALSLFCLIAILLTVATSQVFADGIMGIVDLLAATAGLQIDLDAMDIPCRLRRMILA